MVKVNAVDRLKVELRSPKWTGDSIAMGTNTDPYQRCEGKYRLTRGIVEVLAEARNPFSVLTKSALVLRDLDLLAEAARRTDVSVSLSIGTLDEKVWRATEPGAPHPRRRVDAVRQLAEAGIRTGVLVAPVLPGLSDSPAQLEEVVTACVEAGAHVGHGDRAAPAAGGAGALHGLAAAARPRAGRRLRAPLPAVLPARTRSRRRSPPGSARSPNAPAPATRPPPKPGSPPAKPWHRSRRRRAAPQPAGPRDGYLGGRVRA